MATLGVGTHVRNGHIYGGGLQTAATGMSYSNAESGLAATTIQGAIDEIVAEGVGGTSEPATDTTDGLMSSTDKKKLDTVAENANAYTHPTYDSHESGLYKVTVDATGHVSAATAVTKSDITGLGIPEFDTTYSAATTETAGLMSAADKIKLDGVAENANNYVHPTYTSHQSGLYKIAVDSTGHVSEASAASKEDIVGLGIAGTDTTYAFSSTEAGKITVSPAGGTAYDVTISGWSELAKTADITSIFTYRGTVASIDDLPEEGSIGDVYHVTADNSEYVCIVAPAEGAEIEFEELGTEVDLSSYAESADVIAKVTGAENYIPKFTSDGSLVSSGFTLGTSVPADAKFTDTTYDIATTSTSGLMSADDKTAVDKIDVLTALVTGTITAGETSITLTADNLTAASTVDVYFKDKLLAPTEIATDTTNHTVTLTIAAQATDTEVGIRVV